MMVAAKSLILVRFCRKNLHGKGIADIAGCTRDFRSLVLGRMFFFFFFFVPGLYRRHCMNMHVYHCVPFISEIFYGYGNMTQHEAGSKLSLAMF